MTRDDWPECPGCDHQLFVNGFCDRCDCFASDWSTKTLEQWQAANSAVVAEIRAKLDEPFVELKRTGTGGWL